MNVTIARIVVLLTSTIAMLFVGFNPPWKCSFHIGTTVISKYWGFHTILQPPNVFDYFYNLGDKFHLPLVDAGRYDPRILNAFEFQIDYPLAATFLFLIAVVTLWMLWILKFIQESAGDKKLT
ncbi:MAG TPA: hypothetical protein PK175_05535 [Syntrophales bacterium]|jgi:hypothetical protein|nr:hypothetical protein [Syntrophales bacterium]HPC31575.1 hypothetical protein [Syntrophales bacterium]HQG34315.1 hypothetical protein [Syntrophales bacterium]HRR46220.1 hypothetical protein [Syntrophales bacterium]